MELLGLQDSQQLQDFTPPVITVQSPADGSVLTDSRPTLRFTLTDGDATQRQPDVDRMEVWLDGSLVYDGERPDDRATRALQVFADLENPGGTFLTIQAAIVPPAALSPGGHEVAVYVTDRFGDNRTTHR
jgi:hypothetical protein